MRQFATVLGVECTDNPSSLDRVAVVLGRFRSEGPMSNFSEAAELEAGHRLSLGLDPYDQIAAMQLRIEAMEHATAMRLSTDDQRMWRYAVEDYIQRRVER